MFFIWKIGKIIAFSNIFSNIIKALFRVYIIIQINVDWRINRGCFQHLPNIFLIKFQINQKSTLSIKYLKNNVKNGMCEAVLQKGYFV